MFVKWYLIKCNPAVFYLLRSTLPRSAKEVLVSSVKQGHSQLVAHILVTVWNFLWLDIEKKKTEVLIMHIFKGKTFTLVTLLNVLYNQVQPHNLPKSDVKLWLILKSQWIPISFSKSAPKMLRIIAHQATHLCIVHWGNPRRHHVCVCVCVKEGNVRAMINCGGVWWIISQLNLQKHTAWQLVQNSSSPWIIKLWEWVFAIFTS